MMYTCNINDCVCNGFRYIAVQHTAAIGRGTLTASLTTECIAYVPHNFKNRPRLYM